MKAIVRRPGPLLADGIVTHVERRPVDVELALAQWQAYVDAFERAGWEAVEAPPADDCPDAVFVEDALVVVGDLAVVTRPGARARRAETAGAEETARRLGLRIARIEPPGTLDGGDVLVTPRRVYVGVGGRTNADGARQLAGLLDAAVTPVAIHGVLHLKSAVAALPDGTLVRGHVVDLGGGRVLLAAGAAGAAAEAAARGYEPVAVDVSEFEKLEACVTCLSVRVLI